MKKMPRPDIEYSDVFDACIGSMRTGILKTSLETKKIFFVRANAKYIQLSKVYALNYFLDYESQVVNDVVTHKNIVSLYSKLRDNPAAVKYHDKIKNSSDECLYCNGNLVACLDHYLPKANFSLLSITPSNLIPCCNDCNFKLNNLNSQNPPLAIHPYFEHYTDIFEKQWIYAKVPLDQPFFTDNDFDGLAIEFYTDFDNTDLEESIKTRAIFQFENLIVRSYISKCAPIIAKELNRLKRFKGTANQIKDIHKEYLLDNMIDYAMNSFHYATYYALANSDEYLEKVENEFF